MSDGRKWQKVSGPASWANSQLVPNGLTHQIAFDENAEGWVLVEEAGEKIGREEWNGDELVFVTAADLADRVEDIVLHNEFKGAGVKQQKKQKKGRR